MVFLFGCVFAEGDPLEHRSEQVDRPQRGRTGGASARSPARVQRISQIIKLILYGPHIGHTSVTVDWNVDQYHKNINELEARSLRLRSVEYAVRYRPTARTLHVHIVLTDMFSVVTKRVLYSTRTETEQERTHRYSAISVRLAITFIRSTAPYSTAKRM